MRDIAVEVMSGSRVIIGSLGIAIAGLDSAAGLGDQGDVSILCPAHIVPQTFHSIVSMHFKFIFSLHVL